MCSYCKPDLRKQVNGCELDVRLHPSAVGGENGTAAIMGLMRGFVVLG